MEDYLTHTYTKKDVDNFIKNETEESINLDFKRGDALKNDDNSKNQISKDVASFANSDGGIIVYGIEEIEKHKAGRLSFVDGRKISKEWVEQVINSRIQRKIDGLLIDVVRYNKKIEETIIIVKIPRSLSAPHVSWDKKYYKRYNFESVPMEEYEIRDLYNRQEKTVLKIPPPIMTVKFGMAPSTHLNATIKFYVKNQGQAIEKLYKLEVHMPNIFLLKKNHLQQINKYLNRQEYGFSIFSIPNSSPLFQNEKLLVEELEIEISAFNLNACYEKEAKVKLFFSNGTEEFNFFILDKFTFIPTFRIEKKLVSDHGILNLTDWQD